MKNRPVPKGSKDFLESDFITHEEISRRILEGRKKEELMAVPSFVIPCAWDQVSFGASFGASPVFYSLLFIWGTLAIQFKKTKKEE